ncbi:DUF1028 domain-containing protein [Roseixanthobacter liquoris]|uniref:DUF1028 domain-containing protein n=1 Tax=Roseixanthobacter liquoris TaxID=3119921 RepID=UPI00372BACE9
MTYSIIAACPATGRVGIAIASRSIAVGFTQVHLVGKVGALVRLGKRDDLTTRTLFKLLEQGVPPSAAIALSGVEERSHLTRQVALIDASARTAVWEASGTDPWSGFVAGAGFIASGEGLAGAGVIKAMADSFAAGGGSDFDVRLLAALEAGSAAGGLAGPAERSAALVVHGAGVHSELDLRIDLQEGAVAELRVMFDFYKPYEAFYRLRSENPRQTPPQEAFMATLAATAD